MMVRRWGVGAATTCFVVITAVGCTGGQETQAQTVDEPQAAEAQAPGVDAAKKLHEISPAIPVYTGAAYRADLTRRDTVMARQQFGPGSEVLTLATDDSFPQVWHYYVTYLAQFRAYEPPDPYPPENKEWRTLEVHLNEAMQNGFVPGDGLQDSHKQIILQVAETETEPETVIRYIMTPQVPAAVDPVAMQ